MTANGIERYFLIFGDYKSGDGDGRLRAHVRRRLWDRSVPDVANLAMLFIGGVLMPMPGCLDGKGAYSQNQGHRQQL
jgi:hypothetical protein